MPKGYAQTRRVQDFAGEAREPQPTNAPPGSPEKIRVLAERVRRREKAFSGRDATGEGARARIGFDEKNNHITITGSRRDEKSTGVDRDFAPRLARMRQDRGWSRKQLARRACVTLQCISYLEVGCRAPSLTVARALADAFGVSLDEMVGRHFREKINAC